MPIASFFVGKKKEHRLAVKQLFAIFCEEFCPMQEENFATGSKTAPEFLAIRQNDKAALKSLYLRNYPGVEQYVVANSGTVDEAKDIFQEAFIALWRNVQAGRFTEKTGSSLDAYLFQIARHKWLDHLRSARVKNSVPLSENGDGWEAPEERPPEEEAYLAAVRVYFARLGENCQALLRRFYFQKESLRSIAASFNWTEATAKNNKYRCLQRLRDMIK